MSSGLDFEMYTSLVRRITRFLFSRDCELCATDSSLNLSFSAFAFSLQPRPPILESRSKPQQTSRGGRPAPGCIVEGR